MKAEQKKLVHSILAAVFSKKAEDVRLLDLRKVTGMADFFIICTGESVPQRKAIRDEIKKTVRDTGQKHWHVEDGDDPTWILMDYVDVVVHIFDAETRYYYNLEGLWGDAKTTHCKSEDYV